VHCQNGSTGGEGVLADFVAVLSIVSQTVRMQLNFSRCDTLGIQRRSNVNIDQLVRSST
jgi:hypothetical protein